MNEHPSIIQHMDTAIGNVLLLGAALDDKLEILTQSKACKSCTFVEQHTYFSQGGFGHIPVSLIERVIVETNPENATDDQ
jgi:hypothetical protein